MRNLDDPEDPQLLRVHAQRLIARDIDKLTGICEFALQDGVIEQSEAEAILHWMRQNPHCLDTWPVNVLYDRLTVMLADGVLDQDEQRELLSLVLSIARPRSEDGLAVATTLPLDIPPPAIVFAGRSYCFTGVFQFGTRAQCQAAITERDGLIANGITRKLDYLVIGNIGSEVWKHSTFGLKIAKAVDYRDQGRPLAIISEEYWASQLK